MSFLALADRPELTRLNATMRINSLGTVRKPFILPHSKSQSHRLAGIGSYGSTTHFPGTSVGSQGRRIFVLCFDGTGDQFDADVRQRLFILRVS